MSPARYLVVGGGCAALNWALMLLIDRDRYLLSSILLFVPIGTIGFLLHTLWTFREEPSLRSWIAYLIGMLPGGVVSLAILAVLRDGVGVPLAAALPATVAIMTIANYLVSWCAIKGLAARRPAQTPRRAAAIAERAGRIACGVYRQIKPHVRGCRIPRDEDFSLAVPFGYDLAQAPASPSTLAVDQVRGFAATKAERLLPHRVGAAGSVGES